MSNYVHKRSNIISDSEILQTVSGCTIEFTDGDPPVQGSVPISKISQQERLVVDKEIQNLIEKRVLEKTVREDGEFSSSIFLVPKRNGTHRFILNLKQFNLNAEYHRFKMETFLIALKLIFKGCFMASIDLKDACYGVPVHQKYRKFLKFIWRDSLFQFTCLPNGLSCARRKYIYTKLIKPVNAFLHQMGHSVTGFLDDMLIVAGTEVDLISPVTFVPRTLLELGFVIN